MDTDAQCNSTKFYEIIDTPPAIGVALKNVLATVDYVVIPVEESGWSLDGLMDFAQALDLARDNNEKPEYW